MTKEQSPSLSLCFCQEEPDCDEVWERLEAESLQRIMLPHVVRPRRKDWNANVKGCLLYKVGARILPPAPLAEDAAGADAERSAIPSGGPYDWAGIVYLSPGFGFSPFIHFAIFRKWRPHAVALGRGTLDFLFSAHPFPAVLGWTPANFHHVDKVLKAWGFRPLARIPQGFPFARKDGDPIWHDGVLRMRRRRKACN